MAVGSYIRVKNSWHFAAVPESLGMNIGPLASSRTVGSDVGSLWLNNLPSKRLKSSSMVTS